MLKGGLRVHLINDKISFTFIRLDNGEIPFPLLILFTKEINPSDNARLYLINDEDELKIANKNFLKDFPISYVLEYPNNYNKKELEELISEFDKKKL